MFSDMGADAVASHLPGWLPEAARHYIIHTEYGVSIRTLARGAGCHASTVMRQIRRTETRRDDPLIDDALRNFSASCPNDCPTARQTAEDRFLMNAQNKKSDFTADAETIDREGRRILRRLCEPGACLAVAADMDKAVVVRETASGTTRIAVTGRDVAQAMALKDWIACANPGRISRYEITGAGRAALKRLLAEEGAVRGGFAEAATPFGDQHRDWDEKNIDAPDGGARRRTRYNAAESPVAAIARRKDKDGNAFLAPELVNAAERLREDFELAQMGPRVAQNWDRFLVAGDRGSFGGGSGPAEGPSDARNRVAEALRDLGPGLGDVALRVCCFLEGLETAERRLGWSARSGKVVLRIALQRLKRHYDALGDGHMIG